MRSPGPWRYDDGFSVPVVVDGRGHVIAELRCKADMKETISNGELLAAADKLLETSAELLQNLEELNVKTKASVKLQVLLLEVTGDPRYRKA